MEKKIFVEEAAKMHLRRVFKCSRILVWKALNFKSGSELARKIRYVALKEFGGVVNWEPAEVETSHEEVERTMTMRFGSRVRLVFDKETNIAMVYVDGKEERKAECKDVASFISFQLDVEMRAMAL